jgi:hypothetical protein
MAVTLSGQNSRPNPDPNRQQDRHVTNDDSHIQYLLLRHALLNNALSLSGAYVGTVAAYDGNFRARLLQLLKNH